MQSSTFVNAHSFSVFQNSNHSETNFLLKQPYFQSSIDHIKMGAATCSSYFFTKRLFLDLSDLFFYVLSFAFIRFHCWATRYNSLWFFIICYSTRCHSLLTRCNLLWLVVICCHSLSFVVPLFVVRCHSLHHLLSFVVTRCHSLSLDVPLVCLFISDPLIESLEYKKSNYLKK